MTTSPARRRGRPAQISTDSILDEASRFDLRDLSVRALAARLRISDAAVHYHFKSREGLLRALVDRITADFKLPRRTRNWRLWLRQFALGLRAALRAHPGAADYLVVGGPTGPRQLEIVNTALDILISSGMSLERAWLTYTTIVNYVIRQVQAEERADILTATKLSPAARIAAEVRGQDARALVWVTRAIERGLQAKREDMFAFGLEALLRGVARAPATPP